VVDARLAVHGYDASWQATVYAALRAWLETPLDRRGMRLADVPAAERIAELEFHLPVAGRIAPSAEQKPQLALALGDQAGGRPLVTREKIAAVFRKHPSEALRREYADRLRHLSFVPLEGYLKGYIDLVFVHRGRWYLADYKSNHLGDGPAAYAPDRLGDAMMHGHYYLQYHLYALALHRWLGRRLPNYDYGKSFGGVYYLFLKGMSPEGAGCGVFFEKPPRARIEALSKLLDTGGEP
jgi:exodeoxyribonuclease V beta subunit